MSEPRLLPVWAEDLRRRYLRGEASMFVLHGNVYDVVLCHKKMIALTEFLTDVLLKESKETIAVYNVATGVRFTKSAKNVTSRGSAPGQRKRSGLRRSRTFTGWLYENGGHYGIRRSDSPSGRS